MMERGVCKEKLIIVFQGSFPYSDDIFVVLFSFKDAEYALTHKEQKRTRMLYKERNKSGSMRNTRSGSLAFPDIMSVQNIGVQGVRAAGECLALTVGARRTREIVVIYQDEEDITRRDST